MGLDGVGEWWRESGGKWRAGGRTACASDRSGLAYYLAEFVAHTLRRGEELDVPTDPWAKAVGKAGGRGQPALLDIMCIIGDLWEGAEGA